MAIVDLFGPQKPQWVFQSDTAGEWDVYFYSVKAMIEVEKYTSGEISDPIEAIRRLIGTTCKRHTKDQEDDESSPGAPTTDDLAKFAEEDINDFSRQFLEHDNSVETKGELEKTEEQSDAEFLLNILEAENKKQSGPVAV